MNLREKVVVFLALVAIAMFLISFFWILLDPAYKRDRLRDEIRGKLR